MTDPQFVIGGPRIPSELIRALEEERLVFFCGAGISIRTGLPNFRDLSLEAIKHIDRAPEDIPANPAIRDAYCLGSYDKALNILEDIEGRRGDFRRFVAKRLTKRMRNAGEQLRLHRALLDLSRLPPLDQGERGYRLVTTNYDDRFERAGLPRHWIEAAPRLARPQANRTGYATFLHGRIETESAKRDPEHTSLVLTSADFGDAYLRDGYAARFVLELFREFTVLFIGYSLNDPVMRYLMDIFATENEESQQGQFRKAYAFVAHGDGDAEHQRQLWQAKHVTPILYHDADRHSILIKTLETWARIHRAGSDGRFQILMDVVARPFQGDVDAANVANAAWALSDKDHRIAKRLGSLGSSAEGSDADISWFGPLLEATVFDPLDDRRPHKKCQLGHIDKVSFQMCRWAMRHLASPDLVSWAISNEHLLLTRLQKPFFDLLLLELHNVERSINEPFRLFWQLLVDIAGNFNEVRNSDIFWEIASRKKVSAEELQSIISRLQAQLRWPKRPFGIHLDKSAKSERLNELARYEISDSVDHRDHPRFRDLFSVYEGRASEPRKDLWPVADDLTSLLAGICRLGTKIEALFTQGLSREIRQSIAPDPRNQLELDDWEWLIEAVVQSFEAACRTQRALAIGVAQRWCMLWQIERQALFGRLYLHAAIHLHELSADEATRICLERGDVLWSYEYEPEFLPLLRLRGAQLSEHRLKMLIEQLLAAPSDEVLRLPDIEDGRGKRLAKLLQAGVELAGLARTLADEYLSQRATSEDPREDEVRYRVVEAGWVGSPSGRELVGKGIDEIIRLVDGGRHEIGFPHSKWDKAKQVADWLTHEVGRIAETFEALAGRDDTPAGFLDGVFWALRDVATQNEVLAQLNRMAAALKAFPSMIDTSFNACAAWVKALAGGDVSDDTFWPVWDLIRARAPLGEAVLEDMSLTAAINSAGGNLAEAVIDRFWKTEPKVGQGLPAAIRERLTQLVFGTSRLAVHARLVCMPPLHALYAVDPDWTRQSLFRHLSWANQESELEVSALWATHLNYGRWSLDLMAALKRDFLTTLTRREALDEQAFRSACWRFAALGSDRPGFLSDAEIRDGFLGITATGAAFVLDLFETRLRQSDNSASQWREIIAPWLVSHWPRQAAFRTPAIQSAAADMLLETGEAFPEALDTLDALYLVGVVDENRLILFRLSQAEEANNQQQDRKRFPYARSFPGQTCRWLNRILPRALAGHQSHYLSNVIRAIEAGLPQDARTRECLRRLRDRAR